jgi:anti-sigma B factor antagonist
MDPSVQTEEVGEWTVARVFGDVDVATTPRLRDKLVSIVSGGRPRLVLDLDEVGFLDSTGLGLVVGLLKRTRTHGGDLRLVCTRPSVVALFELTGLDRTLPLAASAADAIAIDGASPG